MSWRSKIKKSSNYRVEI